MSVNGKSTARDMTEGSILKHMILFSLPLILGNVFQLLYNTVDTLVVGNFVGTEALAAVGSTSTIVNVMIFFFNGLSIGAGVVISRNYGAKDFKELHESVETTMAMTFAVGIIFTIVGMIMVRPMLHLMATPDDVMDDAALYLRIYYAGISGLMIYNMGSGVLRAVGDTTRPLIFLAVTSVLNIILDLTFVLAFHGGIAGVAIATIISQFVSAFLVLYLLTKTEDIYKMTWKDLRINLKIFGEILRIGMPAAFQSMITSISNVFVQSYINFFGSACMAGWSCYNKLIQFVFLPMNSMASASTTFVSQNIGAKKHERARSGIWLCVGLTELLTLAVVVTLFINAEAVNGIFTDDASVVTFASRFIRVNGFFVLANGVNHVLAGGIRGLGDSKGPMIIMLINFVAIRQTYLFLITHFVLNTPTVVGLGYPVGWSLCCITETIYYFTRYGRAKRALDIRGMSA